MRTKGLARLVAINSSGLNTKVSAFFDSTLFHVRKCGALLEETRWVSRLGQEAYEVHLGNLAKVTPQVSMRT